MPDERTNTVVVNAPATDLVESHSVSCLRGGWPE
jgi:hypothetical protein